MINANVPARTHIGVKACSLVGLKGRLACRKDEEAEPEQRALHSSQLKEHIPPRAMDYGTFELHDIKGKVCRWIFTQISVYGSEHKFMR